MNEFNSIGEMVIVSNW